MIDMVKTIKFDNKKYKLKLHSYRALFIFEEQTGKKADKMDTLQDQLVYIWSLLKAVNKDFEYTFDEFLDVLENDDSVIYEFTKLAEGLKKK